MEKLIFTILSVNSMQMVTTLIVVLLIGTKYILYDELEIPGDKKFYFYYILLTILITVAEIPLDVFVKNIIECWSPLKMSNKIVQFRAHFSRRKRFWAVNDLAHLLNPETKNLSMIEKLGFSYQYYFLLCLNCLCVILYMIGLELVSITNYNPFTDLCMLFIILACAIYFIMLKIAVNNLFRAIDLKNPDHDLVETEEEYEQILKERMKMNNKEGGEALAIYEYNKYIDANYKQYSALSEKVYKELIDKSKNFLLLIFLVNVDYESYKGMPNEREFINELLGDKLWDLLNKYVDRVK